MKQLFLMLAFSVLAACSSVTVQDYADDQLKLEPEKFFDGNLNAYGVIKDRSGKVTRRFEASILASWENGIGTLDEDFVFDDGEQQKRIWTLTPNGQGGFSATAGDVVGNGTLSYAGNSMFLEYVLRIPYNDGTLDVGVDDRMYLVSENVLINKSVLKKFGLRVGEIVLTIIKEEESIKDAEA